MYRSPYLNHFSVSPDSSVLQPPPAPAAVPVPAPQYEYQRYINNNAMINHNLILTPIVTERKGKVPRIYY